MNRREKEDRPRYDPEKVRARAEEALGWAPGSSRDLSFQMLREALKAKPEKWKVAKDIDDMLRTGEHLIADPISVLRPGSLEDAVEKSAEEVRKDGKARVVSATEFWFFKS